MGSCGSGLATKEVEETDEYHELEGPSGGTEPIPTCLSIIIIIIIIIIIMSQFLPRKIKKSSDAPAGIKVFSFCANV